MVYVFIASFYELGLILLHIISKLITKLLIEYYLWVVEIHKVDMNELVIGHQSN